MPNVTIRFATLGQATDTLSPSIRQTLATTFRNAPRGKKHLSVNRSKLLAALRVLGVSMPKGGKGGKVWKAAKVAANIL